MGITSGYVIASFVVRASSALAAAIFLVVVAMQSTRPILYSGVFPLRVDMRKLSSAAQEALRMRVMAAIGDGHSDEEAAALFGVSTKSIGRWRARLDTGRAEGLRLGTPGRKTGTHRFLSESEEAALKQTILEFISDDLGLGGLLWTTPKVHVFLQRHFKDRLRRTCGLPGDKRRSDAVTPQVKADSINHRLRLRIDVIQASLGANC